MCCTKSGIINSATLCLLYCTPLTAACPIAQREVTVEVKVGLLFVMSRVVTYGSVVIIRLRLLDVFSLLFLHFVI